MSENASLNIKEELLKVDDREYENQQFDEIILNHQEYKAAFVNFKNVEVMNMLICELEVQCIIDLPSIF